METKEFSTKSRVRGDFQARFCEKGRVKFPPTYSTRTQPIDYKSVLSLFLPAGLLDYFDITEASNMGDYFMLVLVEKDIVPENLQDLPLISNGFHKPITVTDFPVRDHTMYFRIKRRRWLDKSTGKSYSRDWNLVASGTRITAEFGAFLKELP